MSITEEYLLSNDFVKEEYGGKTFYRAEDCMITFDPIYHWMSCNPETHCVNLSFDTIEELEKLRALGRQ